MSGDADGWFDVRPGFEAWIVSRPFFKKANMSLRLAANGDYCDYRVNDRWAAWKACYVKTIGDLSSKN
jgi:hypothetical protein